MPSIQSRLFILALKYRHLLKPGSKRTTSVDWNTSIPDLRADIEKGASFFGKLPAGIDLAPLTIQGCYAEWLQPANTPKERVILYFHGGGYVTGSVKAHRSIVSKVVAGSGVGALVFEYRLAPEHPHPAALEDALAAYRWLLDEGISPHQICFMGDSAGGGLCLATILALRDQGTPLPSAAVALSPWTDLKNTGDSLTSNAEVDTLSWKNSWVVFSSYYAGKQDAGSPYISPLYGDLHGFPPLLIYTGGDETLRDDSTRFAQKAKDAGVDVRLVVGEGLFHCYPACAPLFPEARQAMDEICEFIRTHISAEQTR